MTIPTDEVLEFWLGSDFPASDSSAQRTRRWFSKDDDLDQSIRERFGDAIDAALAGSFDDEVGNARDWLALLILLDQFPRNVFRHSPRAFAGDAKALGLARAGIARGDDQDVHPMARLFCYLPFEHSEELVMQEMAVAMFRSFQERATNESAKMAKSWLDFAIRHHAIIERFGRFPHRNQVLGRESTSEELAHLAEPGSGF